MDIVVERLETEDQDVKVEVEEISGIEQVIPTLSSSSTSEGEDYTSLKRRIQCETCHKKFAYKISLNKHSCLKLDVNALKCLECNATYNSKSRLNFHLQFHLPNARPLYCTICKTHFESEEKYYDHVNFKHKNLYMCHICGKKYNQKSTLTQHMATHKHKNFLCSECGAAFHNNLRLNEHVKTRHRNNRHHMCHVCGKIVKRRSILKSHLLTHDEVRSGRVYVCGLCREAFGKPEHVDRHSKVSHENVKSFEEKVVSIVVVCEFCSRCFADVDALNVHRRMHALNEYVCNVCKCGFSDYARLATHRVAHGVYKQGSSEEFPVTKHFACEVCSRTFLQWADLTHHRKYRCVKEAQPRPQKPKSPTKQKTIKPVTCKKCGKMFVNSKTLALHTANVHKRYACEICNARFSMERFLRRHYAIHSVKIWKCGLCGKDFVSEDALSKHVDLRHAPQFQLLIQNKDEEEKRDEGVHISRDIHGLPDDETGHSGCEDVTLLSERVDDRV